MRRIYQEDVNHMSEVLNGVKRVTYMSKPKNYDVIAVVLSLGP